LISSAHSSVRRMHTVPPKYSACPPASFKDAPFALPWATGCAPVGKPSWALDLPAGYATSVAPRNGRVRAALRIRSLEVMAPNERSGIIEYPNVWGPGRCRAMKLPAGAAGFAGKLLKQRAQRDATVGPTSRGVKA